MGTRTMSREIAQTVSSKKFGLILALIAAFAIIATFGYQHAGATSLTDQSMTAPMVQPCSTDVSLVDSTTNPTDLLSSDRGPAIRVSFNTGVLTQTGAANARYALVGVVSTGAGLINNTQST